jgi:HK97 family phage prohead protease
MLYERKSTIADSITDVDLNKREIVGMFSNYQSADLVGDVSHKGMFDRTWKENGNKITLLFEHKTHKVLARELKLWDDAKGAYHKSTVGKTKFGDSVLEMAEAKLLSGHSFGYAVVKGPKNKHGGRDLLEVKHFEVTLTGGAWPVHPNTPIISVKKTLEELKMQRDELNEEYGKIKGFCYNSNADDDTLEHLQLVRDSLLVEIKQLHQTILDLSTLAANPAPEPQRKGLSSTDVFLLESSIQNQLLKFSN